MHRLFAVVVGLGLLAVLATSVSAAPTFRATASMSPQVQYLNDTTGTVFTFTVVNLGDTRFAAVDISRPSPSWVVTGCPKAPAGWTTEKHVWGCRYRSKVTASDDIPGHSSNANFRVKATVRAGTSDLVGRWRVVVSRTRSFSLARDLRSAPSLSPGLRMVAHSFQVLDAVIVPSARAIGSACPAPTAANHSAMTGTSGLTIAICGRNRTTAARTPTAAFASLGGTFIASHGGFASGSIRANSANVVLGNWANVTITSSEGAKTIAAKVGSLATRTSPLTTLSGYTAINQAPVAAAGSGSTNEDTASGPITLSASDANGDAMTFSIVSGPAHGTLGAISAGACPSTAPAAHTCTATVVYTPALNYNGPDTFTYRATDTFGAPSVAATVSLTVNAVNDAPVANPATFSIPENSANGTSVGTATASDVDSGQTRTFSITGGNTGGAFAINGTSGAITVASSAALDFETNPTFSLTVRATDNGSPVLFGQATVTVNLTNVNEAPTVTTSGGSAAYTENAAAVAIDAGLTIADVDDTNVESGQVRISAGFQAGDALAFTNQNGITGSYNSGTGVLTLTGTSSVANYQTALRSVGFSSPSDDPAVGRTVAFTVNDGSLSSTQATRGVTITPVNDAPSVVTSVGNTAYTENAASVAIDGSLTVTDPDDSNIESGVVRVSTGFQAGDTLAFTNQLGITGSYNAGTGILALTGTSSVANYQTALRSVRFSTTNDSPTALKTIAFKVNDGDVDSTEATKVVAVAPVNDAPVAASSVGSTPYTENAAAVAVDSALGVADADDANLESAVVRISANFQAGDTLAFVNQNGISGSYNPSTGVLTLTGTSTVGNYQMALRSVTFNSTNDNPPANKTIAFKVNDGDVDSVEATKVVAITAVNDASTVTTTVANLAYLEDDGAKTIDGGLTVTDPDSATLASATVSFSSGLNATDDALAFTDTATVSGFYDSSTGVLFLTRPTPFDPDSSVADYQAALRSVTYANSSQNPSGSKTISFQVTDTELAVSNLATRTIDLTAVNDAPVLTTSAGAAAYTEGGAAAVIDGSLTLTDADDTNTESGQVRISSGFRSGDDLVFVNQNGISGSYNTGTGVLTLTGSASKADYQTALRSITFQTTNDDPAASETVEYKVNDGNADSNAATKTVAITAVNDNPTVATTGGSASYTEDGAAPAVDPGLTVADPDSTQLQGATASITANYLGVDGDSLNFADQNGISGSYSVATGVLTLTGTTTVSNYETALRSITFSNTSEDPSTLTRTITFQVTDSSGGTSNLASRGVTVAAANDAPVVTTSAGSTAYTEADPATVVDGSITVADPDDINLESGQVRISADFQSGDDLIFVNQNGISGSYNTGTGVLTLTGTSTLANYETALRSTSFRTTNTAPSTSKTIEFKVNDGLADSNLALKNVAVTPINSAPVVTTTATALSYTEGAGPVAGDGGVNVTDGDSTQIHGATVQITGNFASADDELAFTDTVDISGTYNDSTGTLTLSGTDTIANYEAALRAVTYENVSQNPTGTKTLSFQVTDDGGAPSSIATRTINLSGVNDAPALLASVGNAAYTEGGSAATVDSFIDVDDVDDTNVESGRVRISAGFDAGDSLNFVNQNGISGSYNTATGVLTLTGTSAVTNYETALRSITFSGTDDTPTTLKTVEFKVNDGDADSNLATRDIDVTPTNDAPVADDETFSGASAAIGNTTLVVNDPTDSDPLPLGPKKTITGDILDGDADPDGPGPLVVIGGTFSTNDGGSVTIEPDGDFTFQPAAGTSCTDTSDFFDYTVSDQYSIPAGTDTGRVTIAISNCVWYVNNNDLSGNSGTSIAPFDTLAQAETASGDNHYVFVYDGDNTTTGYDSGYIMNSGERLIGESEGLVVGSDTLLNPNAGAMPSLKATNEDVIDLDDGNEVRGFNLDPQGTGGGIAGGAGDVSGTISNVNIVDTGIAGQQPGLELDGTSGTWNISNLTIDNSAATGPTATAKGIYLHGAGTVNFASAGTISINSKGAAGLDADTTNMGSGSVFDSITVAASGSGGVRLFNTTGTTQLGDGSGADLNLTTTSGATAALLISAGGSVSVPSAGTANISAIDGPAIDVTSTSGISLSLDTVSSTNSAGDGVKLSGMGTGTFSASGGTIVGAAGTSFNISGGSGDITYPGTLDNGTGQGVTVTGRTGGTVTFSGQLLDTSDAGGGILVSSNSGGSTVFTNASKAINTTGAGSPTQNNAVVFSASDGHTLSFTGGGLVITTTAGKGLEADTSGTVNVTGSGNTIDTTTGRPLNVTNTDIGGSGVTFQRISSNGAPNGILLNNTASGAFSVTGTGAAESGGTIMSSTGAGIDLTAVGGGASLTRMVVTSGADDGIRASNVTGLALANSSVTGNGNAVGENGLDYDNVKGTSSINNSTITGSGEFNARVDTDNGTLLLTVDTSTFSSNSSTFGADGLLLNGDGTATIRANIHGSTFSANRDDGFQLLANADSNVDLTFDDNTVHAAGNAGAVSAHAGLNFDSNTTSNVKMSMVGGTVDGADGSAIIINPIGTTSTFDATFDNVTIGTEGVAGSGSATGIGIWAKPTQNTTAKIVIKNSHINGTAQFGIQLRHNDGGGTSDFTLTNNVIRTVGSGNEPIFVQSGSLATDTTSVCADIGGAGGDNGAPGNDFAGQSAGGVTDIAFRRPSAAAGAHLLLPGFDGDPTHLASYIQGRNVGSPTVANYSGALEAGPASCQQPAAPALP